MRVNSVTAFTGFLFLDFMRLLLYRIE